MFQLKDMVAGWNRLLSVFDMFFTLLFSSKVIVRPYEIPLYWTGDSRFKDLVCLMFVDE